jgi:hypothetical protein
MSTTFNFASITTEADIKTARDALSKRLAEIKKGLPKEEPVANGGAGKAVEEPVTPVKVTKAKKAAVKTAPEEVKPVAKAVEADEKRKMAFPAGASHTKMLKDAFGDDKKGFENAKKTINKNYEAMSREEQNAKTNDEHVAAWLKLKTEPKAEEPMTFDILSIEELKDMEGLTKDEDKAPGMYWHQETGRFVTGPAASSEEGLDEVGDYLIGETTKRVYDKDEKFLGFAGMFKFEKIEA